MTTDYKIVLARRVLKGQFLASPEHVIESVARELAFESNSDCLRAVNRIGYVLVFDLVSGRKELVKNNS